MPEVEPSSIQQVWVIDDGLERTETDIKYAEEALPDIQFKHFTTGREAIDQLTELIEIGQPFPNLIFLDYNFAPGDEFQYGTDVLPELLKIINNQSAEVKIIPYTSEPDKAKKMEQAGAGKPEKNRFLL